MHGAIDQHYEEQRIAAVTRLIEELERIAEERAGVLAGLDDARSEGQKSGARFQNEILYEAEFLEQTIAELEKRQILRRALATMGPDELSRPSE